ncbi:MAG: hypothetical protein RLZZ431_1419 [Bacteroidota bacterium]
MDPRQTATEIFLAGLEGVKPENLIKRFISIEQHNLQIENFQFDLSTIANIYIVGVGKASAGPYNNKVRAFSPASIYRDNGSWTSCA